MKEIQNFDAGKYQDGQYEKIEDGIFRVEGNGGVLYVTSLSFVQEPEFGEGRYADRIAEYPLEDILDRFCCHISDFYEGLNDGRSETCYLEFAAPALEDVRSLRAILGRHVYNKDADGCVELVIE